MKNVFLEFFLQNPKRGRYCFELRMTAGHKSFTLAAENEDELKDWLSKLSLVLLQNKIQEDKRVASLERAPAPSPCPMMFGTLKGLEQSMNPQLIKYGRETDISIAQARREHRRRLFACYQSSTKTTISDNVEQYREQFGKRIFLCCESLKFRLQCSDLSVSDSEELCQVEPYITSLAVYDAKAGRKLTESFYFNINNENVNQMLPNSPVPASVMHSSPRKDDKESRCSSDAHASVFDPLSADIQRLPPDHFENQRRAIFSVTAPHPDIFLVVRIEKILQGGIYQTSDPYIKTCRDPKVASKLHKSVKSYAQNVGHYRQPFAWAARPLFRLYGSDIDIEMEFPAIYRQESNKLKDEELLKLLAEYRKPDKFSKLTVIPGYLKVNIEEVSVVNGE